MNNSRLSAFIAQPLKIVPLTGAFSAAAFTIAAWALVILFSGSGETGIVILPICFPFVILGGLASELLLRFLGVDCDKHLTLCRNLTFCFAVPLNALVTWIFLHAITTIVMVLRRRRIPK
jgi:hypothetical protein